MLTNDCYVGETNHDRVGVEDGTPSSLKSDHLWQESLQTRVDSHRRSKFASSLFFFSQAPLPPPLVSFARMGNNCSISFFILHV